MTVSKSWTRDIYEADRKDTPDRVKATIYMWIIEMNLMIKTEGVHNL